MPIKLKQSLQAIWLLPFLFSSPAALAQESPVPLPRGRIAPINLDLSSTARTVSTPGKLLAPVKIALGGTSMTVVPGALLTPAERLAVSQVLFSGYQSIVLSAQGAAVGGRLVITPHFAEQIASLTVPLGVSVIDRASTLNLTGNLINSGSLYAVSASGATSITANNIINQPGGLISNVLPIGWPGLVSAQNTSLNLNALNSIDNSGKIYSSGSLSLTAGGSITNASQAVIQSGTSISLSANSGSYVNNGLISAQVGNITFASAVANDITINNLQGTIKSLKGEPLLASVGNNAAVSLAVGSVILGASVEPQPGPTSVNTVPTSTAAAQTQITDVLGDDWSSWTGSSSGDLTVDAVGKLLKNPNISGSQAAVLGMIGNQMWNDIDKVGATNPSYTQAQATAYLLGTNTSKYSVFSSTGEDPGPRYFTNAMEQIRSSRSGTGFSLYGNFSGPVLSSIQQALPGNCFYLAAIDSVLNQDPKLIANMITSGATTGTYIVTFPKGQKQTVTVTDGIIANYSLAIDNGCWLAVMGLAENNLLVSSTTYQAALLSLPLGAVSSGGSPKQTYSLLTGNTYSNLSSPQSQFNATYISQLLQVDMTTKIPIGVSDIGHALSIIGFNQANDMVTIMNPAGYTGSYKPDGNKNAVAVNMVKGVFSIPTSTLVADYAQITALDSLLNPPNTTVLPPVDGSGLYGAAGLASVNLTSATAYASAGSASLLSFAALSQPSSSVLRVATDLTSVRLQPGTGVNLSTIGLSSIAPFAGDEGIRGALFLSADFGTEVVSQLNQTGLVTAEGKDDVLNLRTGNIVLAPKRDVVVTTDLGRVVVAKGAIAFVMKTDDSLSVYDLADARSGDIAIVTNGHKIAAAPGVQLLLTRRVHPQFELVNSAKIIGYRQVHQHSLGNDIAAFTAEFSIFSALSRVKPLRHLATSHDPLVRKMGRVLLQNAVAVSQLSGNKQPYRQCL